MSLVATMTNPLSCRIPPFMKKNGRQLVNSTPCVSPTLALCVCVCVCVRFVVFSRHRHFLPQTDDYEAFPGMITAASLGHKMDAVSTHWRPLQRSPSLLT